LGQNTPGGFGQFIRVPGDWIVPLPAGLTLFESMALGTAGLTAAIGIHHLRKHQVDPGSGPVLVTGATGGVGTMAVGILAALGYEITAATGKTDRKSFLERVGATSVIHRDEVQDRSSKPLLSGRWSGVIETVGGLMLDTALRQTRHDGTVACCGNVLGGELHTNVYPFILRGVTLAGIDSGNCPMKLRRQLWKRLGASWKPGHLPEVSRSCSLEELDGEIKHILEGQQVGRVVVEHEE
ncbi:MAG TPA: YhdH/YhfP family quinone oxidoreductase, partial [Fodinibius sp.]|nr:YhdH/YhfP family quinone oxidoreductase [Fodinibius sp.]